VQPALEFDGVGKSYKKLFGGTEAVALRDFSLRVNPGEIFGFLGPNGAGKTTALHIAMGFVRASSGGGTMLGRPFGDAPTRRRVGFLAENVALYNLPAEKCIRFYGALNAVRDPQLRERTRSLLAELDLADVRSRKIGKFSRGMLQRVGLAQALVNDPELLVLDEPTSALDPLARVEIRELLLRAKTAGKTIFLSSHLLSEIENICDRVAFLVKGQVARLGKLSELLDAGSEVEIVARRLPQDAIVALRIQRLSSSDGLVRLRGEKARSREIVEAIWQQGGEVISMNPARATLEEMFLELAEDGEARGAGARKDRS
jgi:ABC-2 type transport system ATP-binding protein